MDRQVKPAVALLTSGYGAQPSQAKAGGGIVPSAKSVRETLFSPKGCWLQEQGSPNKGTETQGERILFFGGKNQPNTPETVAANRHLRRVGIPKGHI